MKVVDASSGSGKWYYYEKNLQGDIVGIMNADGYKVVSYSYDAWGVPYAPVYSTDSVVSASDKANAALNPFRYRGYYYDSETGYYYLQTRYYNPEWGRFINADGQLNGGLHGCNQFAYCSNNPVMNIDPNGRAWWHWALAGTVVVACAVATVATCGGFAAAATAVGLVASGTAAATTASTIAAGAFVASATTLGAVAFDAAINSSTEEEFMDNGNWETVASTALSGLIGAGYGYLIDKLQNSNYYDSSSTNRYCEKTDTCFVAGTLIETENGSLPIELILVGMKVYATDPNTGEIALKEVLNTFVRKSSELIHITVNGEKITTTPTHPFWVPQKGWVDAIQLRAGDRLQLLNGEYVIIEQIQHEILETPITVYNFEVAKLHTYYVSKSRILVHNANCGITSPNQMQMQVERGQAPKGVLRVDNPKIPGQQPHIHFSDGTSLNIDGSVHDRKNGIPNLTNEIKIWLEKNGWKGN